MGSKTYREIIDFCTMDMPSEQTNIDAFLEALKSEFLLQEYQQINDKIEAHFQKASRKDLKDEEH